VEISKLINELEAAYTTAGLDCGYGLQAPASEDTIRQLEEKLAVPLPEELKALLRVHGGQEYIGAGTTGLFGRHRLLSPSEIVEWYEMTLDNYQLYCSDPPDKFPPEEGRGGWWNPRLIPFASWDAYGLCIHSDRGDVWNFEPYSGLIGYLPSIAASVRFLIDEVKAGREAIFPYYSYEG
jgi:cell wall assembly regulator SMI1